MKRSLSIPAFCFLFSALCYGQFNFSDLAFQPKPVAGSATSWNPTNNSDGTYPVAWWDAADYYTNTYVYLPDRTTNGMTLTNQYTASQWPTYSASGLNSQPTITFLSSSSNELRCSLISKSQPVEFYLLIRYDSGFADNQVLLTGDNGNLRYMVNGNLMTRNGVNRAVMTVTAAKNGNNWMVDDIICLGTSTQTFTNNTTTLTASDGGTASLSGLKIGASTANASAAYVSATIAAALVYSGAIPGTNATWRSNVFWYLKTRGGL